jgi:hypothetical protein
MPINNIRAIGDDQKWKSEVEKQIASLTSQVSVLKSMITNKG